MDVCLFKPIILHDKFHNFCNFLSLSIMVLNFKLFSYISFKLSLEPINLQISSIVYSGIFKTLPISRIAIFPPKVPKVTICATFFKPYFSLT